MYANVSISFSNRASYKVCTRRANSSLRLKKECLTFVSYISSMRFACDTINASEYSNSSHSVHQLSSNSLTAFSFHPNASGNSKRIQLTTSSQPSSFVRTIQLNSNGIRHIYVASSQSIRSSKNNNNNNKKKRRNISITFCLESSQRRSLFRTGSHVQ